MKEWFLFDQEKQEGPYDWQEVLQHYEHRPLSSGALIWKQGLDNWVPLTEFMISQAQNKQQSNKQASNKQVSGQLMAAAASGLSLPWQTMIGHQLPDMKQTLTFVAPTAKKLVGSSIKRPALSLAIITIMDLVLMMLTGGISSILFAFPRLASGIAASMSGLFMNSNSKSKAKSNNNPNTNSNSNSSSSSISSILRIIAIIMSILTLWTQGASVFNAISLLVGYGFVGILPMLITSASALPVAFKLLWHTAKGVKA
ncbi:conserved membrane protein of unknown function [Petrocella atlantisensis]|uniref:GYF domain-containing protein n=1 Tax=Petrocella atlantisensis TaxID=2173034 RepID=A0A3P7NXL4_9FIRM|nr:DUF4339 domain-containing protein [Petrocella atlantisensis]VDN47954.1 conserved membrane protein of unknown function [Petrocella atlantisensis]